MENLKDIFLLILNMSITASYIAIVIIAIRFLILRKLPKIFSYSLWGILLFRLVSPICYSSGFSFLNLFKTEVNKSSGIIEYVPQNIEMMEVPTIDVGINSINKVVNSSLPHATELASMNSMQLIMLICTIIWIIGIIGFIIYSAISYIKVMSKVKTATLLKDKIVTKAINNIDLRRKIKVYATDQINSPFVCGFITPKVYIPVNISNKELSYILTHEFVHVKRFDYIIKPFSYLLLIIHWFNPILWISFKLMSKDMEMSCDEKVMEALGNDIKHDYSYSLLSLAVNKKRLLQGSPLAFGESNVKSRIKNILSFKKPSLYIVIAVTVLIVIMGISLLTNPKEITNDTASGLDYERIYECRTEYVGDASKVGNLTSMVYYSDYKDGISLKTDSKPYEVTVNYLIESEDFNQNDKIMITDKMLKNAAIMFCLIDNVDKINFNFNNGRNTQEVIFTREIFSRAFNNDIRNYSSAYKSFRNELIPMLETESWNDVDFEVYITNKIELYVWRNKEITGTDDVYYTLLPGTNRIKSETDIYDLNLAVKDLEIINDRLSSYQGAYHLSIRHDSTFAKQDMLKMDDEIIFNGNSRSIGGFGDGFNKKKSNDIGIKVEELLETIISSPMESSNPYDYIKAHQKEYETILKMGDGALQYMLSQFQKGEDEGLKSHIMMRLCIDILGDRNNVKEDQYTSPKEWYSKLSPYEAKKLPPFEYESTNDTENMVYSAAINKYSSILNKYSDEKDNNVTIVAPKIFGTYKNGNELKIFVTVFFSNYKLYNDTLCSGSSGVVPAAIVYSINDEGSYTFKEYIEAKDGAYFSSSIEEFCIPRKDIAKAIMKHYGNYSELFVLMKENLIKYLKENELDGIKLKQSNGDIIPLI